VDLLILSQGEVKDMTGVPLHKGLGVLEEAGPRSIVVTLGKDGCTVVGEEIKGKEDVEAFELEEVEDTTGAGDAFTAGFLYGLLKGEDYLQSALTGNAAAALKIMQLGARSGLPTPEELEEYLATHKPGDPRFWDDDEDDDSGRVIRLK